MNNVYKGRQTGALYQAACGTAVRMVRRLDVRGMRRCGAQGCVCGSEDDLAFRRATEDEAEAFWRALGQPTSENDFWNR